MTLDEAVKAFAGTTEQIKLWHWQTRNAPEHEYLGEFYDRWTGLVDKFVETYAGRYDRPSYGFTVTTIPYQVGVSYTYMQNLSAFMRSEQMRSISTDSDLLNILDEITGLVNRTTYKLSLTL